MGNAALATDPLFLGTQVQCTSSARCAKKCGREALCPTRTLEFVSGSLDQDPKKLVKLIPQTDKHTILDYRQHSAMDTQNGIYYLLLQTLKETARNVTSSGPPLLFSVNTATSPPMPLQIPLRMQNGDPVPPMESIEFVSSGKLVAVGRQGEVYVVSTSGGLVEHRATLWDPPALLAYGLTAFDSSTQTLYAISQQPQPDGTNDPVCGSTHGPITCPVNFFSLPLGNASLASSSAKNLSSFEFCFSASNAQLGCRGTNIQRMFWDPNTKNLVGVTRSGRFGPSISSFDVSGDTANITNLYNDRSQTFEFVSGTS
jgi:hypothetical protein